MAAAGTACAFVHRRHPGRVGRGDGWVADETWICSERAQNPCSSEALTASSLSLPSQRYPLEVQLNPRTQWPSSLLSSLSCFTASSLLRTCQHLYPEEHASKTTYLQTSLQNLPSSSRSTLLQGLCTPPALALYRSCYIGHAIRSPLRKFQSIPPRHPGLEDKGACIAEAAVFS